MRFAELSVLSGSLIAQAVSTLYPLPVVNITRPNDNRKFENLAIRADGQVLTTTTYPNASIYQVDPLGILPEVSIHNIANVSSATGIAEGEHDIFYVASGSLNLHAPLNYTIDSSIVELDLRGVYVKPDGALSKKPAVKIVAKLPRAGLLNGIAFARPQSKHLLVADSFQGLIWNVNICDGSVGITLNDTTTKGLPVLNANYTGINGLKVHNGTMYWTVTGKSQVYKLPVDENGNVLASDKPELFAENISCDDLVIDHEGDTYVAAPSDVITKVSASGQQQVIAGTYRSNSSSLVGPTAMRFGRLASDRWSLYLTTNGGMPEYPGSAGLSRIDLNTN